MDIVGSEIGQKMRSAIKAKLTELGCYVDDELPDYVMVMVANKRTREQMNDDLSLFLGNNTQLFVNWLHQVLKKLQEVTVTNALTQPEKEPPVKTKTSSKEKKEKSKEKKEKKSLKEKHKKKDDSGKKSKKVSKKDKKEKKDKKSKEKKVKKKSKTDDVIRLSLPPLLMNLEKNSEPSITDVFAGQILKNHGISFEKKNVEDDKTAEDVKPSRKTLKRNRFPIIDPATVTNVTDLPATDTVVANETNTADLENAEENNQLISEEPITKAAEKAMADLEKMPREEQLREMNEIEAKIQGLKRKLAQSVETLSEDEDFLNIRTEAEELMNDFAEDVLQEISSARQSVAASTPPIPPPQTSESQLPQIELNLPRKEKNVPREELNLPQKEQSIPSKEPDLPRQEADTPHREPSLPKTEQSLPHIELNLPKRPLRDRLGAKPEKKRDESSSAHRTTPDEERASEKEKPKEREKITFDTRAKEKEDRWRNTDKTREGERRRQVALPDRDRDEDNDSRYKSSSGRAGPASVVRVRPRPRPRPAPAPALLMRAVADAHKSLLNVAPKPDKEPQVKRALVLPMRRHVDKQNIVIQVQTDRPSPNPVSSVVESQEGSDCEIDLDTDSLTDLVEATDNYKSEYVPSPLRRDCLPGRGSHVPLLHNDNSVFDEDVIKIHNTSSDREKGPQFVVTLDGVDTNEFLAKKLKTEGLVDEIELNSMKPNCEQKTDSVKTDRAKKADKAKELKEVVIKVEKSSEESTSPREESNMPPTETKKPGNEKQRTVRRKPEEKETEKVSQQRKRRASPIVFDVKEKEEKPKKEMEPEIKRERKESGDSDITVTTTMSRNKYDSLPSLSPPGASRSARPVCRAFPHCRYGLACHFRHPTTKPPLPVRTSSRVVPVASYKSITPVSLTAPLCRYHPACAHPACPFLHPKPCRYGANCLNRPHCNFYHNDAPSLKWKSAHA